MNNAEGMKKALAQSGKQNNSMNRYLHLYNNLVVEKVVKHTNEQLAKDGIEATNAYELRQVIALFWVRSRYNIPAELLWVNELAEAAKREKFKLLPHERFNQVLRRIRGCSVMGRDGNDDKVWTEVNILFGQLKDLKREIFQPSLETLLNKKNGTIVKDGILVPCRAADVEKKTLSCRKTGKEGPVADCMADSVNGKLFGMKIQELGKYEHENIEELMERMPTLTHVEHNVDAHFDRGYGKIPNIIVLLAKG
jgi:hypothetical protein